MIFEKSKFYNHNFFRSLLIRVSTLRSLSRASIFFKGKSYYQLPQTTQEISTNHLDDLNSLCHTNAFAIKDNKLVVTLSLCDSCGDCTQSSEFNLSLVDYQGHFNDGLANLKI
jgi:ferredoxin-like protein FixX